MNPTKTTIVERLRSIDGPLEPLVAVCERYLHYCSAIDLDGTLMLGHQPWKGPEAYAMRIFPPARKSWFSKYSSIHGLKLPTDYKTILSVANGIHVLGLSLYGIPPSMVRTPPLLDRSRAQCLDIGSANADWKTAFPGQKDKFHFGGRHHASTQNSGYFSDRQGKIIAVLKTGDVVGEWLDFRSFLTDELLATEAYEMSQTPNDWWH